MSKITLNIVLDIDDTYEQDLLAKITTLKQVERMSEFSARAIKKALDDPELTEEFNKKIQYNNKGVIMDRKLFYDFTLKKLAYLEEQIASLRYDMHTAAVLADKALYKDITTDIMSVIDTLFNGIKNSVQISPGEYVDSLRWKQREQEIIRKFEASLSNFRLLSNALEFDESLGSGTDETVAVLKHTVSEIQDTLKSLADGQGKETEKLTETLQAVLESVADIKEIIRTRKITSCSETPETSDVKETEPTDTEKSDTSETENKPLFQGDLSKMAAFFGA